MNSKQGVKFDGTIMGNIKHLILLLVFSFTTSHASNLYYLCGGDENGCSIEKPSDCICIPRNDIYAEEPYCLNFETFRCLPLKLVPQCDIKLTFKNQSSCLAVIFQSEPEPPCPLTQLTFCLQNHAYICNEDGEINSCHPT